MTASEARREKGRGKHSTLKQCPSSGCTNMTLRSALKKPVSEAGTTRGLKRQKSPPRRNPKRKLLFSATTPDSNRGTRHTCQTAHGGDLPVHNPEYPPSEENTTSDPILERLEPQPNPENPRRPQKRGPLPRDEVERVALKRGRPSLKGTKRLRAALLDAVIVMNSVARGNALPPAGPKLDRYITRLLRSSEGLQTLLELVQQGKLALLQSPSTCSPSATPTESTQPERTDTTPEPVTTTQEPAEETPAPPTNPGQPPGREPRQGTRIRGRPPFNRERLEELRRENRLLAFRIANQPPIGEHPREPTRRRQSDHPPPVADPGGPPRRPWYKRLSIKRNRLHKKH